jgi:undecaprenyl-diphosphatase
MAARSARAGGRWWTRLERHELEWLVVGLAACVLLFAFVTLAGKVMEGDTQAFDVRILKGLRDPSDLSRPIGPAWMESSMFDLTAVGGPTVLWMTVLAVAGYLALQARYRTALVVLITSSTGELLNAVMKLAFNRPRPTVVPHLREVYTTSFPSGHAMESAIVYLTLGAILMRAADTRGTKIYILAIAGMLTALAGVSRVYLGVHYPTDVIGGWIVGFSWASVCWLAARQLEGTTHIQAEKNKPAGRG